MNSEQSITLQSINNKLKGINHRFKYFIIEDKKSKQIFKKWMDNSDKWKTEIEGQISPIIKERNDYTVVKQWWKHIFHVIAVIIGFIISISVLIHEATAFFVKK